MRSGLICKYVPVASVGNATMLLPYSQPTAIHCEVYDLGREACTSAVHGIMHGCSLYSVSVIND